MSAAGYGEGQPRLDDDRLPVMLVILDGLGDRPISDLGGLTPSEAAVTPVLDRLTQRGASGWHVPLGWGRAPSSELAHWAMFGYTGVPFPGRAVLEGIGAGVEVPTGIATTFAALRTSEEIDGRAWLTGRAGCEDHLDADALLGALGPLLDTYGVRLQSLGRGEALLQFTGYPRGDVTDSDAFFETFHPWLRVQATEPEADPLATAMNAFLLDARELLQACEVNRARADAGRPALDVLTTKWSGTREPVPDFIERTGVAGAAVTSARMYRGLAGLLGITEHHQPPVEDLTADVASRVEAGAALINGGARFVHVHVKATDEAGHTKHPRAKLDTLEALDPGLAALEALADRMIVAITGDHATPSTGGVLHTADPTPLLLVGPTVRADGVDKFGETHARAGWFGVVNAPELLPLLFGHANRPVFLGHRATPRQTVALPDYPEAMPLSRPNGELIGLDGKLRMAPR